MAIELAAKAARMAPARVDDLNLTVDQLGDATVDDLGGSRAKIVHANRLPDILNVPGLRPLLKDAAFRALDDLESRLRSYDRSVKNLYNAARYPDEWSEEMPAPSEIYTEQDAQVAMVAMSCFMGACSQFFAGRYEPDSAAGSAR